MVIVYDDGKQQGYNVWTAEHFRNSLNGIFTDVESVGLSILPDIIVQRLKREHIAAVLKKLIEGKYFMDSRPHK